MTMLIVHVLEWIRSNSFLLSSHVYDSLRGVQFLWDKMGRRRKLGNLS